MEPEMARAVLQDGEFLRDSQRECRPTSGKDSMSEDPRFKQAIGHAALRIWPDLPRDMQERLFEDAVGDDAILRRRLALYLHDRHPRTTHPPRPTAIA
jgi:hypothetical protein